MGLTPYVLVIFRVARHLLSKYTATDFTVYSYFKLLTGFVQTVLNV